MKRASTSSSNAASERSNTTIAFLQEAIAFYGRHGIRIRALLTDNGSNYRSRQFRQFCAQLGVRHSLPRPYPLAPTARPNASYKPPCANGLTPATGTTPTNATPTSSPGCTTTPPISSADPGTTS